MTAGNGSGVRCGSEGRAEVNITGRKLEAMLSSGFRHRWKNGNGSRLFRYFLPVCVCVCFFLFLSSLALFLSSFRAAAEPEMKKAEVSGTERMLRDSWSIGNCCYKGSSISLSFPPSPPTHSPIHPPGFLPASCLYFLPVLTLLFQSLPLRRNRFQKPLK